MTELRKEAVASLYGCPRQTGGVHRHVAVDACCLVHCLANGYVVWMTGQAVDSDRENLIRLCAFDDVDHGGD